MLVGLHDADQTAFPNLALMKLSAACKAQGKATELWWAEGVYGGVISSKVFTFTEDTAPDGAILGGYGRGMKKELPEAIEHICPDYGLYGIDYSLGFLTRGCPCSCPHCFVPEKEGGIQAHADITEFLRHDKVVLMDNNVLASDHGIAQIEKLARLGVKVDFNQGLDAKRIDDGVARRLAALKWSTPLRLACDSEAAIPALKKAVELLRWHNCTPRQYFCYVLVKEVPAALEVVKALKGVYVDPFAQPFINAQGEQPSREQRRFARWVNLKQVFKSVTWEAYQEQRGDNI